MWLQGQTYSLMLGIRCHSDCVGPQTRWRSDPTVSRMLPPGSAWGWWSINQRRSCVRMMFHISMQDWVAGTPLAHWDQDSEMKWAQCSDPADSASEQTRRWNLRGSDHWEDGHLQDLYRCSKVESTMHQCKGRLSASVSPYGLMLGRRRFFVTQGLKGKQLLCPMLSLASHVSIAVSTGTSEGGNDEGSRLAAHWTGNECSRIKSSL